MLKALKLFFVAIKQDWAQYCACVLSEREGGVPYLLKDYPGGSGGLEVGHTHTDTHIEDWNIHIKFHASGMFAWKRKCNVAYSDLIILVD